MGAPTRRRSLPLHVQRGGNVSADVLSSGGGLQRVTSTRRAALLCYRSSPDPWSSSFSAPSSVAPGVSETSSFLFPRRFHRDPEVPDDRLTSSRSSSPSRGPTHVARHPRDPNADVAWTFQLRRGRRTTHKPRVVTGVYEFNSLRRSDQVFLAVQITADYFADVGETCPRRDKTRHIIRRVAGSPVRH